MTQKLYAIIRHAKLRSLAHVRAAAKHNDRTNPPKHIRKGADTAPVVLLGPQDWKGVEGALKGKIKALDKTPRRNQVLMVEQLLTASPAFFKPDGNGGWDKNTLNTWKDNALQWIKDTHGDRLIQAVLHLEESSPHIHVFILPAVDGRLCCREFTKRQNLIDYQTSWAKANEHLGLRRGVHREGVEHTPLKDFYEHAKTPLGRIRPKPKPPELSIIQRAIPSGQAALRKYAEEMKEWEDWHAKRMKTLEAKGRLYAEDNARKEKEAELRAKELELKEEADRLLLKRTELEAMEALTLRSKAAFIKKMPRDQLAQAIGIPLPGHAEVFDVIRRSGHADTFEDAVSLVVTRLAALDHVGSPTPMPMVTEQAQTLALSALDPTGIGVFSL